MKQKIQEKIIIPEGIDCTLEGKLLTCKFKDKQLSRKINIPGTAVKIHENSIIFECPAGNKNHNKKISTFKAHINNMFSGLKEPFIYTLQAVNVHFPMTLKTEKNHLLINNFLGEKNPRKAEILPGVDVQVKGQQIIVSSPDKELAGHTAANIERATKVRKKDRRIFQDGVYITEKPRRTI